ncbi:MAG TPA: hypothetical protein VL242_36205 [Sorangium sp.]|nr:hypothetical protein [Sorangium sp.]
MRSRAPASSRGIAATLAALALAGAAAALLVWPGRVAPPRPPSAESTDEARLVDEYRAVTGLSPEQLDALLALPYAAGQGAGDR